MTAAHVEKPGHCPGCAEGLDAFRARLDELQAIVTRVAHDNEARCLALADLVQRRQEREAAEDAEDVAAARVALNDPRPSIPWEQVKRDLGLSAPPVGVSQPLTGVRVEQAPVPGDFRDGLKLAQMRREYGTAAILRTLEDLERADVLAYQDADLMRAGDHKSIAGALRAARVIADDAETRLREGRNA